MRLANARMHRARVHSACIAVRNGIMLSTRVCTAVSFMRVGVVATAAARAVLLVRGRMHRSIPFSMMDCTICTVQTPEPSFGRRQPGC